MDSPTESSKPKGSYWKFVVAFLAIIFIVFSGLVGWGIYLQWQGTKGVERLAEALKRSQEDDYKRAMADTYGGKTPQETLQMYISAVEKGDYELASKYFIGDNQEKELKSWQNVTNLSSAKIMEYVSRLKSAINVGGQYTGDKKRYEFNTKLLIDLKLYPNGIWKLIEI